jgi:hypothetical protein
MIISSFIIQANVITIVNYDRQTFIVQATEFAIKYSTFFTIVLSEGGDPNCNFLS